MSKKYERRWGWFTLLYEDDHSNHKVKKYVFIQEKEYHYKVTMREVNTGSS